MSELLAALIGLVVGFVVGCGLSSDAKIDSAKSGYIIIDKQAYRLVPAPAQ
jgi:hypothetical protein